MLQNKEITKKFPTIFSNYLTFSNQSKFIVNIRGPLFLLAAESVAFTTLLTRQIGGLSSN
jgi:hypothetical protein